MKALTQEQVESYRHNGFLFPVPALTPDEIAACLAGLERLETELGSPVAEADVKWRSHAYAHSPWFNTLIRHPRILDAIEDVIGPDILVWTSTFFIKEPHSPTFAAWHQDGTYFGLEPTRTGLCLGRADRRQPEAGCMEQLSSRGEPRQLHHAPSAWRTASTAPARRSWRHSISRTPWPWRCAPASSRCITNWRCTGPRRTTPSHRRVGIGLNYLPAHVRVEGPVRCKRDAGARRGSLRPFRPDRSAGRRARCRCAGGAPGSQRPVSRELQHPGEAPRGTVRDRRGVAGRVTDR